MGNGPLCMTGAAVVQFSRICRVGLGLPRQGGRARAWAARHQESAMRCFTDTPPPPLATTYPARNPGQPLDLEWLESVQADDVAITAKAAEIDQSCEDVGSH